MIGLHGHNAEELAWRMMNLGYCVGLSVGLSSDPRRWMFDRKTSQRRRMLLWELKLLDAWSSLWTGRPQTLDLRSVDCQLPEDMYSVKLTDGDTIESSE